MKHLLSFQTLFSMLGWLRNPATPNLARLFAGAALLYLVMPLDMIPDLIPVLGLADDVTVFTALMTASYLLVPGRVKNPRIIEQRAE